MPQNYVMQLRHYLDDDGELPLTMPTETRRMGLFVGGVVAWTTRQEPYDATDLTNVPCMGKRQGKVCLEPVLGLFETSTSMIHWKCPACKSTGVITNWERSQFDRRS